MYVVNKYRGKTIYTVVNEGTHQDTGIIQDNNTYVLNNYRDNKLHSITRRYTDENEVYSR